VTKVKHKQTKHHRISNHSQVSHLDLSNRLATMHQHHRQTGQTDRTTVW